MKSRIRITVSKCEKAQFETVLRILSKKIGLSIEYSDIPVPGGVNIGGIDFAKANKSCSDFIFQSKISSHWEMIFKMEEGGCIVSGEDLGRINCAFLTVVDNLLLDNEIITEIRYPVFNRMYQNFDDCSFGFSRAADNFDLELHMLEMLRIGLENFEINRIYDDIPIQVREKKIWWDKYQWWNTYMPALDMFYESSLTSGTYNPKMLRNNRKVLLETAKLARELGLKPVYTAFEPRAWPQRLFERYPELIGARVDLSAYSCEPEYAPDVNHPLVLNHYRELVKQLLQDVPDLDMFEVWSQDSAAGFPWALRLYPGANGPNGIRKLPLWQSVNSFMSTIKDEASKYNKDIKVNINISWVFLEEEQLDIIKNIPENIGISFSFNRAFNANISNNLWDLWETLKAFNKTDAQALREGIGCNWKIYGPLFGFPFPRGTFNALKTFQEAEVQNISLRGGIVSSVFVPNCINNEVIKEFKFKGNKMDLDAFLTRMASKWTNNKTDADILKAVWDICDEFDSSYSRCGLHWTTALFISPRTLFRKMIIPIVPDLSLLSFEETRYYKPNVFLTHETDPSLYDISFFNFEQRTSDENMQNAVLLLDNLLQKLEKCMSLLDKIKDSHSEILCDLRDRIECFYYISETERNMLDTQINIHLYKASCDDMQKIEARRRIKENMHKEIDNTEKFIKLLKNTKSVLIPVTSGEETPYMFKAPLYNLLECKVKVMKKHFDDIPGPEFNGSFFVENCGES